MIIIRLAVMSIMGLLVECSAGIISGVSEKSTLDKKKQYFSVKQVFGCFLKYLWSNNLIRRLLISYLDACRADPSD